MQIDLTIGVTLKKDQILFPVSTFYYYMYFSSKKIIKIFQEMHQFKWTHLVLPVLSDRTQNVYKRQLFFQALLDIFAM